MPYLKRLRIINAILAKPAAAGLAIAPASSMLTTESTQESRCPGDPERATTHVPQLGATSHLSRYRVAQLLVNQIHQRLAGNIPAQVLDEKIRHLLHSLWR